jgi:hypothetical protein
LNNDGHFAWVLTKGFGPEVGREVEGGLDFDLAADLFWAFRRRWFGIGAPDASASFYQQSYYRVMEYIACASELTSSSAFSFPLRILDGCFFGAFCGFCFAFSHLEDRCLARGCKERVFEFWEWVLKRGARVGSRNLF